MSNSNPPSGTSTPRAFTAQSATAEDLLKSQTVGLVNLADFRKRRADVLELKEKEARERTGTRTPESDGAAATRKTDHDGPPSKKLKKKKAAAKGLLSFGGDEDEDADGGSAVSTPAARSLRTSAEPSPEPSAITRKLTPNPKSTLPPPRAITKAALAADALERERLRKEFLEIQERVKETEIEIPFVFYEAGANVPGGSVKVKKGDHVWLFLDRCRKVGAELGVSGSGSASGAGGSAAQKKSREDSKKQWARVGVDDLMLVRGEVIVPHHYEFYYFIANKIPDPSREGKLLFEYSGTADVRNTSPGGQDGENIGLLRVPRKKQETLEGQNDDPTLTKVVDRRWYERNKHIYPASVWKEFKPGMDFEEIAKGGRRDPQGNAFFFG
ncbi:uncharacterized protein A1O5_01443 [Cladophialophora psammophila CBS 110553]|uniref:FAM50A/XAP5 C-terminal domain-containing protein n=1 Tax=Cladophialophora psammophila CBS 110553 TaxID=1182543 RepID=W9X3G5_9EURO|nr:uncharacterized protein A1O5_01443 [Cladophialophora psammophila CBS 110553]EXJ74748.1 hypothetical protein A1O5_01443 [Cladophialophora psammophila CBS 110553]